MRTTTPWGPAQSTEKHAEGITFYSTAGHGGFKLSPARAAAVLAKFPGFTTWLGDSAWWEEDCDATLVVATFPQYFPRYHDPVTLARLDAMAQRLYKDALTPATA